MYIFVHSYEKGMVVMATIALFSGQGSQYEKMGLDLVQQDAALEEIFEVASEVLGFDLYAVIADSDAQTLAHTIYAQPAIMATSLVCLEPSILAASSSSLGILS